MTVVRIGDNNEVVIPEEIRDKLGVKPGDLVQARFERVDDSEADEPMGPEAQASIEEGLKDVTEGREYGPYDNAADLIRHLRETPPESSD